jgi:hypothetical protein
VDDHDECGLPGWVKAGNQTTDGHLAVLAASAGGRLAKEPLAAVTGVPIELPGKRRGGTPERIRTSDLLLRRQTLYPD